MGWGRKPGGPKYGNSKTLHEESGITFDSKWEHDCYVILLDYQNEKKISDLNTQNRVNMVVNGIKICAIVIDFRFKYQDEIVFLDAKSAATSPAGFRVKMKLFEAIMDCKLHLTERRAKGILDDIDKGNSINNKPKKSRLN